MLKLIWDLKSFIWHVLGFTGSMPLSQELEIKRKSIGAFRRSLDLANLSEKKTYALLAMIKENTEESLEKSSLNEEKNG